MSSQAYWCRYRSNRKNLVGIVQNEKPLEVRIGLAIHLYLVRRSPFRRVEVRQKRYFGNIRIDKRHFVTCGFPSNVFNIIIVILTGVVGDTCPVFKEYDNPFDVRILNLCGNDGHRALRIGAFSFRFCRKIF